MASSILLIVKRESLLRHGQTPLFTLNSFLVLFPSPSPLSHTVLGPSPRRKGAPSKGPCSCCFLCCRAPSRKTPICFPCISSGTLLMANLLKTPGISSYLFNFSHDIIILIYLSDILSVSPGYISMRVAIYACVIHSRIIPRTWNNT